VVQTSLQIYQLKKKKTYSQNWPVYNKYQTEEKMMFLKILNNAVDALEIPYQYAGGRPHYDLSDLIKCLNIKVFNCFSSRRTNYELQVAYGMEYIKCLPHFNTLINHMGNPEMTQHLHRLYKILAMPLVDIENNFAIDATGFSTFNKNRWIHAKLDWKQVKDFKKLHIISGVRTNIITAARVTAGKKHDSVFFPDLVRQTSMNFKMKLISADAGYLSRQNCNVADDLGIVPYILPREGVTTKGKGSLAWRKMLYLWETYRPVFEKYYHMRSNVESTFSMIKRKYLPYVRSKSDIAQFNEILCKVVCHNASVLVNCVFELGIDLKNLL